MIMTNQTMATVFSAMLKRVLGSGSIGFNLIFKREQVTSLGQRRLRQQAGDIFEVSLPNRESSTWVKIRGDIYGLGGTQRRQPIALPPGYK